MASTSGISTVVLIPIVIIIIAIINTVTVSAVHEGELNVVFGVLRARGYHLFANAIATSDIHYDITSNANGNFTLFAPINSALFALDMTMAASNYVSTLRYHVVPRRLSISDLLSLPPGSNSVPTLVPGHDIVVEQRRSPRSLITVEGVDIVVPGMFYGRDIAVHGLEGVLEYRPHSRNLSSNIPAASLSNLSGNLTLQLPFNDLTNNQSSMNVQPPLVSNSTGNNTFRFPPSSNQTVNQTVTVTSAVSSPARSPMAHGFASPNSAFLDLTRAQHVSRAKLLELSSDGTYDLSLPSTEPNSNRLQQFTPVDENTLDCSLADNGGVSLNTGIHARNLQIASDMICAQK